MPVRRIQVDVIIPTQTQYIELIGNIGEQLIKGLDGFMGDKEALAYQLNLVLTEATANAIKHSVGEGGTSDTVRILICIEDTLLTIKVFDHGQGFDLESVPLPDFEHPREGGMGLYLIRAYMDTVSYKKMEHYNLLEMCKTL